MLKHILIHLTCLLCGLSLNGQDLNMTPIQIIESIIQQKQDSMRIYYYDSIATEYNVAEIKNTLADRKFKSMFADTNANNTITLTKAELKYIYDQLDSLHTHLWPKDLFSNSTLVSHDSIGKMIFDEIEKANRLTWNPRTGMQIWEFTYPIFIRENNFFLVFTQYICGSLCGYSELCFYKKIESNWKKWITVSAGVF